MKKGKLSQYLQLEFTSTGKFILNDKRCFKIMRMTGRVLNLKFRDSLQFVL